MEMLSIDDVASTSDEVAARRRFDGRNLVWLTILLFIFLFTTILELTSDILHRTSTDVAIAAPNCALVLLLLFVMRDVFRVEKRGGGAGLWGVARWIRRHVSATVILYTLVQYSLLFGFTRNKQDWTGWAIFIPMAMLAFRLLTSEIVLVHLYLYALPVAMVVINGRSKERVAILIATAIINILCAGTEILMSVRLRREIAGDWGERRRHAREQLRMRDELQYARQLQISMLPERPPQLAWVDVAGASVPANEVGGDYYDYFPVAGGLAIVEGDVAGHGMASGIVLASLRSGFTLLRESLTDPAAVLQRLHDLVAETSRRRVLVTAVVLFLDPATRRVRLASAGHPPVIARRTQGVDAFDLFCPPLGVRLPMTIPQRELSFESGDVFVLHTDGVYESVSPSGENYGIERIMAVVAQQGAACAEAIRDAILRDVETFRSGAPADDDVTVVVARIV
jgi:serine phosphatase RsbU (regulator of sigma subunit)